MLSNPAMTSDPITASIHIDADPARVFDHFTRAEALAAWIAEHAVVDPRPNGEFALDIRGVPVRGRYLVVEPPTRLVISWGHAGSDRLPPGASTLEVRFDAVDGGTMVHILHSGLPEPEASRHRAGWLHFLDRLRTAAGGDVSVG